VGGGNLGFRSVPEADIALNERRLCNNMEALGPIEPTFTAEPSNALPKRQGTDRNPLWG
jgi:hypothetical protein